MDESLKARRSQFFVDSDLQGVLLRRVLLYWLGAIAIFAAALVLSKMLWGAVLDFAFLADMAKTLLPAVLISLLPLPFVLRDLLRVTHRFAGPMLRIRRGLNDLAQRGAAAPIAARQGDAWPECISDFNQIARCERPQNSDPR